MDEENTDLSHVVQCSNFGAFLQMHQARLHLANDELGRLLGVTASTITNWRTGALPPQSRIGLLAKALRVAEADLYAVYRAERERRAQVTP